MMSGSSRVTWAMNLANESSVTSHSRLKVNREEDLVMAEREPGMVDALRFDDAGAEIAEMIVVGGGDGELDLVHRRFPPRRCYACQVDSVSREAPQHFASAQVRIAFG